MDFGLKGKVALIGGASKGLGKACALVLAQEGASVAVCARTEEPLMEAADQIRKSIGSQVFPVVANLSLYEDVQRVVRATADRFGRIDILVCNAGGPPPGLAAELDEEQWRLALDQNFLSAVRLARECIPHMKRQGGGRIITILSRVVKQPEEMMALSNAARLGVVGFTKTLALEVARHNILVNNVCPGAILTDRLLELMRRRAQREGRNLEEVMREEERMVPQRRLGRPEEVAHLVAFLASDKASYINGCTIQVDGGRITATF